MTIVADISRRPLLPLLLALSGAHLLNDLIASMIPAMYPLFKEAYKLDFAQIGLITLAFHATSSLLQPVIGYVTDHKPWAYAMVAGMASTLIGVVGLASANNYAMVLVSVALVGLGSAVFHPEATRMARHAAAGHQGFAQGIFQIGGHVGCEPALGLDADRRRNPLRALESEGSIWRADPQRGGTCRLDC
jgi:FSR family fosmidomycin resistance protein-like MFS transporter